MLTSLRGTPLSAINPDTKASPLVGLAGRFGRYARSRSTRLAAFAGLLTYLCYAYAHNSWTNPALIGVALFFALFMPSYSRISNKIEIWANNQFGFVTAGRLGRFVFQFAFNLVLFAIMFVWQLPQPAVACSLYDAAVLVDKPHVIALEGQAGAARPVALGKIVDEAVQKLGGAKALEDRRAGELLPFVPRRHGQHFAGAQPVSSGKARDDNHAGFVCESFLYRTGSQADGDRHLVWRDSPRRGSDQFQAGDHSSRQRTDVRWYSIVHHVFADGRDA